MERKNKKGGKKLTEKQKKEVRTITLDQQVISYTLIRKRVKNINIRVKQGGEIIVSASPVVSTSYIDELMIAKKDFIVRAVENQKKKKEIREYCSGEVFSILGKEVSLFVQIGKKEQVDLKEKVLCMIVNEGADRKQKEMLYISWREKQSKKVFEEVVNRIYPIFRLYGIAYPKIRVRTMTSRWGSCHYKKGIITLNSRLLEKPMDCIDYVVVHEFAHFLYPNHSKQFHQFVESLMPDWKKRKKMLEK